MADYTASEHARLLIAEAFRFFADPNSDEQADLFAEAITEADESGETGGIIGMLASSAAEGWARYGAATGRSGAETLVDVFANWAVAEEQWRQSLLP